MDACWIAGSHDLPVPVWEDRRARAGLDQRALAVIALCAALPVLIGIILTANPGDSAPAAPRPAAGHWVYVPNQGVAVHVNGSSKRVDATVEVGSASTGSPVLQDRQSGYLVDDDRVVLFDRTDVTGDAPAAGVAEQPVPVEGGGAAYLVYRTAGLIVRLDAKPATVRAGGPLAAPVVTPNGQLWTYRVDSGRLCRLTDETKLHCPAQVPAGHTGALAVLDGTAGFVDVTASTWQALGGKDKPVPLGVSLPENAVVGAGSVAGKLAIIQPTAKQLVLVAPRRELITVPLGEGRFSPPVSTGGAVAVVNTDTGTITTYDARGKRKAELTAGAGQLTTGGDGRAYADSTDGLQSVVMDHDGTLTTVATTKDPPPTYKSPPAPATSLPPATVVVTTTETVPPLPETITVVPSTGAPPGTRPPTGTTPPADSSTPPPPDDEPGRPSVDVLDATVSAPGQATVRIRVSGADPVFCHVFFNSVERAATRCSDTMTVVATGLAAGMTYDVYVLGTNAAGTGIPGQRGVLNT